MELENVIRGRRSIRAYRPEPVPEGIIREILDVARWAPSARNTQAWNVWVLTRGALERFKAEFKAAVDRDEPPAGDLPSSGEWPAACSARATELMASRAATLEAAGEATDMPAAMARMANVFGAPCLLVFGFEGCLAEGYAGLDTGMLVENVCLAAHDKGLGTCITSTLVRYPEILRGLLPGAEEKRFVVAVPLGYPEPDAAANTFTRSRAEVDEIATWVS